MSLTNPLNKMSKSAPKNRSRILITAEPSEIRSRIKGAVTDSIEAVTWDPENRPGVANLLELLSQCDKARRSPEQLVENLKDSSLGGLKRAVADAVVKELEGVRERYWEALDRKGGNWITEVQEEGAEKARENARETMRMVRDVVGLSTL